MEDLTSIEKRIAKEEKLKNYLGNDRIVLAEDKKKEIIEDLKNRPKFRALSGLDLLDESLDGFRKGQLVVLSGPPKNGKTAFCQTITRNMVKEKHKCLWFSYELGYEELFGKFPLENLNFYVPNYLESGNVDWIEDKIIEAKQKYGLDAVFIDHLDFLRDTEVMKGISLNLSTYVGSIVQKVKRMAVKHEVIIFLMSHIRKNKWSNNELPSSEEIRDSGQITQLADTVLMVIRKRPRSADSDEMYDENKALVGIMENRHNGKTKKVHLEMVIDGETKYFKQDKEQSNDTKKTTSTGSKNDKSDGWGGFGN